VAQYTRLSNLAPAPKFLNSPANFWIDPQSVRKIISTLKFFTY
jgi:hypothetical protein